MAEKTTTLWVKPADSEWSAIGVGTKRGVWAEDVELRANDKGSSGGVFTLKREPRATYPDLLAATPVIAEVGGKRVWKGRISDTPTRVGGGNDAISVTLEGNQAQLDDDQFVAGFVHTDLSAYQDFRSQVGTTLSHSNASADGVVSSDNGMLYLGFPKNFETLTGNSQLVGVVLDLGPDQKAKRVVVDHQEWGTDGSYSLFCRGADAPHNVWVSGSYSDAFTLSASGTRRAR